jgi:membrane protease YdiL (CAAX protease family)
MTEPETVEGFWDRAATWKAFLLIVVYLVFYLAVGRLIGLGFAHQIDSDDPLGSAASILLGIALGVAIGGVALLVFAGRLGWLPALFGRQPVRGRGWMWISPVLVLVAIVAHVAGIDWSSWSGQQLAAMVVVGVCVGFTEELATRGLVVKILRDAGHAERYVAAVSSLVFALMHTTNLISGMSLQVVAGTVVYTFGFGMCMYLAMRVTGTIWTAVVLHGLTDPTTFLATGGIDKSVTDSASGATTVATLATVLIILFGVVAVFLVRGRQDG